MGHQDDEMVAAVRELVGSRAEVGDDQIRVASERSRGELGLRTGRVFAGVSQRTIWFVTDGLPFVEVPDLHVGSRASMADSWPIPDPCHPQIATVVQVGQIRPVRSAACSLPAALREAGALLSMCVREGRLASAVIDWFMREAATRPGDELGRQLLDPDVHTMVAVAAGLADGWWLQVTRRLRLMTADTPEDHRLVEPIAPAGEGMMLTASEPTLIVARVTEHPVTWVMAVRLREISDASSSASWRLRGIPDAVHRHGLPVITLDEQTTADEASALLLLAAYWHGYLEGEESEIPAALIGAFPREVSRIQRGTDSPDASSAAALLFERLLRPGLDALRSAEVSRHYVRNHARTIVVAHRTAVRRNHPWDRLGIKQRAYYKLLETYGQKDIDGTYDHDEQTLARIREHLDQRARRAAALELLSSRGFGKAAARKWLRRHPIDEVRTAWPRSVRMDRDRGGG